MKKEQRPYKTVEVAKDTSIYTKLSSHIAWLQEQLESIPEEFRDSALIDITVETEQYSTSPHSELRIHYSRPENDEEYALSLKRAEELNAARKAHELKTLEMLLTKYPDGIPK